MSMTKTEIAQYMLNMPDERLTEIIEAEAEGRLAIKAKPLEETCGSCKHFRRTTGNASGICDTRKRTDRWGGNKGTLYVTRGRKRCKDDYEPREDKGT